jgi:polyisoprenoid-binding protein YceI
MMTATARCHFSSFDGTYRVRNDLTIRDETREVEVEATVQGAGEDSRGTERVGVAIRVVFVAIQPVLRTRPVDRLNRRRVAPW